MSLARTNPPQDEQKTTFSLPPHITCSTAATIAIHPFRVCLNRASMHQSPFATIKDAYPYLFKGVLLNILRGSLSTSTQSYAKQSIQERLGFTAGIFAAAACGTMVATFIETPFMRKTMSQHQTTTQLPLWRFSPVLSGFFFLRELGFCLSVLAKNDLSPTAQHLTLFGATWITASTHKFAALEATRDSLPKGITTPDFRQGLGFTIRAMANGNIYTHPAFQVPFSNPINAWAKTGNLLHVSCGANMFLFRLIYLFTFREAYHLAKEASTSSSTWGKIFNKTNKLQEESIEELNCESASQRNRV